MTILDLADSCRPPLSHNEAKRIGLAKCRRLRGRDWRIAELEPAEAALLRPLYREAAQGPELPGLAPELAPQVFLFDRWRVRVALRDGTPWFVARDILEALGYKLDNISNRIGHVPEKWKGSNLIATPGEQNMLLLSLPGLFFFLNRSDKPAAQPFQEWVNGEVLVQIHETGEYRAPAKPPAKPCQAPARPLSAAIVREYRLAAKDKIITSGDFQLLVGLPGLRGLPDARPEEPRATPEEGEQRFGELLLLADRGPAEVPR